MELGWPGIAVAEEHGGQGLGAVELAVLLEELGYACAATPVSLDRRGRGGAAGRGHRPRSGSAGCRGWPPASCVPAIGTRELAADGAGAEIVAADRRRRGELVESPRPSAFETIDPTRRFARVTRRGRAARPRRRRPVRAAVAAEVVGVCQRALEMTLAYVKERKQFGVPVGSFQAVAHRCAEMLLHTESARSAAYFAAWAADADPQRLPEAAALAAAAAADGGREVTAGAIQMHGGIGFTWEADVHWLYKRAQLDAALLGGTKRHRAALARLAHAKIMQPA